MIGGAVNDSFFVYGYSGLQVSGFTLHNLLTSLGKFDGAGFI